MLGTSYSFRDVISTAADVLIVFYIIYRALKLVRGTRAAQTMAGMALIIGLFFLAKRLDLVAAAFALNLADLSATAAIGGQPPTTPDGKLT